jgi:hypothetical protein
LGAGLVAARVAAAVLRYGDGDLVNQPAL